MVNKQEYAWEDIKVILPGKATPVEGITEIEYGAKREHTNIYAKGSDPVAMGRGKREPNGKIKLLQSEYEGIMKGLAKGKDITDLAPFNITVAYAPEGGVQVVDQLLGCRFTEYKKSWKTGDDHSEIELPLMIMKVVNNI